MKKGTDNRNTDDENFEGIHRHFQKIVKHMDLEQVCAIGRLLKERLDQLNGELARNFKVGDKVLIDHPRCRDVSGVVVKVNQKTLNIHTEQGERIRASMALCKVIEKGDANARSAAKAFDLIERTRGDGPGTG